MTHWRLIAAIFIALSLVGPAIADDASEERASWWLTTGFVSKHHDNNSHYRENNPGIGVEWHWSESWRVHAGHYRNSLDRSSNYLQLAWMPLHWGSGALDLRAGASVGVVNGYPPTRDGGYFPTLVPTLTLEYRRVGVNLVYIPSVWNVDGAVALQLKLKLF